MVLPGIDIKKVLVAVVLPVLSVGVVGGLFVTSIVVAQPGQEDLYNVVDPSVCEGNTANSAICQQNVDQSGTTDNRLYGPSGILTQAANLIAILVGIASVIMIVVGGIQYALSAGDPSKASSAKNTIIYALVGLVVTILARAIITFVLERLG